MATREKVESDASHKLQGSKVDAESRRLTFSSCLCFQPLRLPLKHFGRSREVRTRCEMKGLVFCRTESMFPLSIDADQAVLLPSQIEELG